MRAIVIGGGIGGAAAAIALRRAGADVRVYERAPGPREAGAGVTLMCNAFAALDAIGASGPVIRRGQRLSMMEVRSRSGRLLSLVRPDEVEPDPARRVLMIHRAELLGALLGQCPPGTVRYGRACASVEQDGERVRVRFAGGGAEEADVLIGADGLRSAVRACILGPCEPRYVGHTCWRAVIDRVMPGAPPGVSCEMWGRGARFGFAGLTRGRTYWYATRTTARGGRDGADVRERLLQVFGSWADPVPALIAATEPAAIIRRDIMDTEPSRPWGRGRITLLGDAAHACTPDLGQGACLALEDAAVLGRRLEACAGRVEAALRSYEAARHARVKRIAACSRRLAVVGQWRGAIACALRDRVVSLTPAGMTNHGMRAIVTFSV